MGLRRSCGHGGERAYAAAVTVAQIARDQGQGVDLGGGGDEHVGLAAHHATPGKAGTHLAGAIGNGLRHGQYLVAADEAVKPGLQTRILLARQAVHDFIDGHRRNGHFSIGGIDHLAPRQRARIRAFAHEFRNDIGIGQLHCQRPHQSQ